MNRFKKRVVVAITGSNRGLGFDLAKAFSAAGYSLILHARNEDAVQKTKELLKIECPSFFGDLRSKLVIDAFECKFKENGGSVLINNAAILCPNLGLEKMQDDQILDLIKVNLSAVILLSSRVLKIDKSATIININSLVGLHPKSNRSVYAASKSGLKGFSESLRLEIAPHGGRVLEVFLSRVRTHPEYTEGMIGETVAKRIVDFYEQSLGNQLILDGRKDKSLEILDPR